MGGEQIKRQLLRGLVVAALLELLINRIFTRVGLYIPKNELMSFLYRAGAGLGQVLLNFGVFLSLVVIVLLAIQLVKNYHDSTPPAAATRSKGEGLWRERLLLGVVAMWLMILVAASQSQSYLAGKTPVSWWEAMHRISELGVVLLPIGLIIYLWHKGALRCNYLSLAGAAVVTCLFLAFYLINPHLVGILVIWSLGYSLFLPVSLYSAGLFAGANLLFSCFTQENNSGNNSVSLLVCGFSLIMLAGISLHNTYQYLLIVGGYLAFFQSFSQD